MCSAKACQGSTNTLFVVGISLKHRNVSIHQHHTLLQVLHSTLLLTNHRRKGAKAYLIRNPLDSTRVRNRSCAIQITQRPQHPTQRGPTSFCPFRSSVHPRSSLAMRCCTDTVVEVTCCTESIHGFLTAIKPTNNVIFYMVR